MESHREAEVVRASVAVREVVCEDCSRTFRRESDCKRHKCIAERRKPQCGSVQCQMCRRWFRSKGGLQSSCADQETECSRQCLA